MAGGRSTVVSLISPIPPAGLLVHLMMVLGPAAWGGEHGECPRLHPCVCSRVSTVRQSPQSLRRGQTSFELLQATVTFEMNREGLLCLVYKYRSGQAGGRGEHTMCPPTSVVLAAASPA